MSEKQNNISAIDKEGVFANVPIEKLHPFTDLPFKVEHNEAMDELADSIKNQGILIPLLVRPKNEEYEVISGHRRLYAAEMNDLKTVPVRIKEMSDDEATICMVDSNVQRENLLPSERAFAYKMKLNAIKHQGQKNNANKDSWSKNVIAEDAGVSTGKVEMYIHLTNLIPEVLNLVDEKKIAITPAYEISFLKPEEQKIFLDACDFTQASPSLSQAQRLRMLSKDDHFTLDAAEDILSEVKKGEVEHVSFKTEQLRKYFPRSYTNEQMQKVILKLLDRWQRHRIENQQR